MKIYFASDHAGFALKQELLEYVQDELQCEVEDCGAYFLDETDDYPDFVKLAAEHVSKNPADSKAIILGASGQGEAIVANRFPGVRAVVFYGDSGQKQTDVDGSELNLLTSSRIHNDANVLSLGARFLTIEVAKASVREWLSTDFGGNDRHVRRIKKIDSN